ncbi:beta-galactosidase [Phytohabitans aurantiacus]|uniref:Beta-galactosidase n=1 Tax=Phytohabitans aurantiacus TaxID=3016789 RepID=A0ABQ5QNH6_9ACTN|nr:beta-galactosidase [Phytohabitans aurantiacus]GLH95446.1 beta-galactosidase [Phytohabitans aurantiacus]
MNDAARTLRHLGKIGYGGDYNPEQWPEPVWHEDVRLMREAGVNLVSVGIFAWASMEPAPGEYDFGWLDRVVDMLHDAGIAVDLATPTAAPPAWFFRRHPDTRQVTREGHALGGGARHAFCPSSPAYREAATGIAAQLARRYGDHPALVLWHVHNEYGWASTPCYCETSATAFRDWLRQRYGTLDALNAAWGTTFWGQRYGDWEEIDPPRLAPPGVNPAQQLDYMRFTSAEYLACFRAERDVLHRLAPGVPVTTNFMVPNCKWMDYWQWASEVDVVSNDHYLQAERTDNHIELAMAADLTRSVARGRPWLLMEHSTGAVNWQPRNIAKRPGEMRRNSFAHIARGADSALFFQWRASRFGAEKFHSAMLPHGGTGTRIWRDVVRLGADLSNLDELVGTRVVPDIGIMWDWESWWALELEWRPSIDHGYLERLSAYYERAWRAHRTVDFVHPDSDLSGYPMVLVPSLYLMTSRAAANLAGFVRDGGTAVVSYFSGIVDENETVHPGGHPGALREVLGLSVEEFLPLRADSRVRLDGDVTGDVWTERLVLAGAEPMRRYLDGPAAGEPAVTRHRLGSGTAWYVSTRLNGRDLDAVLADAGLIPDEGVPEGVELVRRAGDSASYLIAINHSDRDVELTASGKELLTGAPCHGVLPLPAGEVRVLRAAS